MENFKFIVFSIFILIAIGGAGYWAFSTIESGSTHVDSQKQKELTQKNFDLEKQVADLTRQVSLLKSANEEQVVKDQIIQDAQVAAVEETTVAPTKTTTTKAVVSKNQSLINDLQKLVDGKVYLKLKSQGVYVGTIQKFFNLYNNTNSKVDNDFGASTVTLVKNFQKAQGLKVDGATGPTTYLKMINWLKK